MEARPPRRRLHNDKPEPGLLGASIEHFTATHTIMFVNYMANCADIQTNYYDMAFPRLSRVLSDWEG